MKKAPNSRSGADTGAKTNGTAAKRKRTAKDPSAVAEADDDDEPDVQEITALPPKRSRAQKQGKVPLKERGQTADGEDAAEELDNGRLDTKKSTGKGKTRGKPGPSKSTERGRTDDDAIEVAEEDEEVAETALSEQVDAANGSRSRNRTRDTSAAPATSGAAMAKELARHEEAMNKVQEQLKQVTTFSQHRLQPLL